MILDKENYADSKKISDCQGWDKLIGRAHRNFRAV